ncbi:MAG: hypothetical protein WA824_02795 [Candidatus Sulfotelmatobacter sp.]
MNYRVQLSTVSGLHGLQSSLPRHEKLPITSLDSEDAKLFRAWMVYDPDFEAMCSPGRSRKSLLGLALAMGIGAGFWTAAGLLIARLW